jgi:hypothetical protein
MKETLLDIRRKIAEGSYQNEEHIRLSVVCRILYKLGWDIWNPSQVNAEYCPVRTEDKTKVDIALFSKLYAPLVFIEVKGIGRITDLQSIEYQMRDYNRNNTATFSIITDGQKWRFYYSQTGGEFSKKCFKVLDLVSDGIEELEANFGIFLGKTEIDNGRARQEAEKLLQMTQRQRTMEECLPSARRKIQEPPFPSLPEAFTLLVSQHGFEVSRIEAEEFIASFRERETVPVSERVSTRTFSTPLIDAGNNANVQTFAVAEHVDLRFTSIIEGKIGPHSVSDWNPLVYAGIRLAYERGHSFNEIRSWLKGQLKEGSFNGGGFRPVAGTNLSWQNRDAMGAWSNALILAQRLRIEIKVHFEWRDKDGAAYPGKQGIFHWVP